MICLQEVKKYCQEYWKIENYDQAVADESQTWHCHHRHEIDWALPMEELIAIGRYYDVHYSELIFLTPEEHKRLHFGGENNPWYGKEGPWRGKQRTKETKQKMSDARKCRVGENAPNYKYHITEEELYDLYVVQGLSVYRIAKMYGCSTRCIQLKLKKYHIYKSSS